MFSCRGSEMQPGNRIYQSSQNRPFDSCWRWAADYKLLTGRRNYDGGSSLCSPPLVWGCKLRLKFKNADFFFLPSIWGSPVKDVRRHRDPWPVRFKQLRPTWEKKQRSLKTLRLAADFLQISQRFTGFQRNKHLVKNKCSNHRSVAAVGPELDMDPGQEPDCDPEQEPDSFQARGLWKSGHISDWWKNLGRTDVLHEQMCCMFWWQQSCKIAQIQGALWCLFGWWHLFKSKQIQYIFIFHILWH